MRRVLLLTMTGLLCSAAAWAGDPAGASGAQKMPPFTEIDVNQNGLISADEAERNQLVKAVFVKADADKDGSLSSSEYAKAGGKKSG